MSAALNLNRAAMYLRMSDDRQEDSIERQRAQLEPYAAREGYTIVAVYIDEGIAGDEEKKRKEFLRMLADAQRGMFEIILCDDKDRFGRFDSLTYGYYVKPLRDVGVVLETVAQGRIDWESFSGRITDAILQEAKKVESQANSRRVITWMVELAKRGKPLGGKPPYGYRWLMKTVEVNGREVQKPDGLIPGDPMEIAAVRLMFMLYAERGFSLDGLARELYERGILNPNGGQFWNKTTIRGILGNRKYVGDALWNHKREGKYSQVLNGRVHHMERRPAKRRSIPEDWVVLPAAHEPLIDRELFERVQARLAENQKKTNPAPKGGAHLLTGLLVCGTCGWRLIGSTHCGKRFYKCGRYHQEGRHACFHNSVMESKVVNVVVSKLQEVILNPENLARLRAEVLRQEENEARLVPVRTRELERQLATVERKIDQGMERMAMIDADLLTDYAAKVRAWKQERQRLVVELGEVRRPAARRADLEALVKTVEAQLCRLREVVQQGDPGLVRTLLRDMVAKVELHFDQVPKQGKTSSVFNKGLIFVKTSHAEDAASLTGAARRDGQVGSAITIPFTAADLAA